MSRKFIAILTASVASLSINCGVYGETGDGRRPTGRGDERAVGEWGGNMNAATNHEPEIRGVGTWERKAIDGFDDDLTEDGWFGENGSKLGYRRNEVEQATSDNLYHEGK